MRAARGFFVTGAGFFEGALLTALVAFLGEGLEGEALRAGLDFLAMATTWTASGRSTLPWGPTV